MKFNSKKSPKNHQKYPLTASPTKHQKITDKNQNSPRRRSYFTGGDECLLKT
jgi:hypothetical protein